MAFDAFNLEGKVALVTGGNGGIGLGFAEALAAAGADVCIWGRSEEKNQEASEKLRRHGHNVVALKVDVGNPKEIEEGFAKTLTEMGRIDSCFANAGIGSRGTPFAEMSLEEWREIFRINMEGAFLTLQGAVRHMMARNQGGSLVVTSSSSRIFGAPRSEHYSATKAGLESISRGLAVEYARYNIRCNAVVPGWIETAMTAKAFANPRFQEKVLARIPIRRWGQPADFGGIAVYLASEASKWHTGDSFTIDGGYACF